MNVDILYEDNHILAANKPAGLHTQSCSSSNLEDTLKGFIKGRDQKKGNVFLHAVHRLDQPVGGIVLFAKTQKALSRLNACLRNKSFHKEYEAIVEGQKPSLGPVVDYLVHGEKKAYVVGQEHCEARRAELEIISVQGVASNRWRITVKLLTGRYHQIRAQLSHHGMPIVGDSKYGGSAQKEILLHHTLLSFPHPTTHVLVTITSEAPF